MGGYTFISYAHENTRFALKLARDLQKHNILVRIDQWDESTEGEWDRALERMISGCSHFLVVLSPAAVNSWVVQEQFSWAAGTGKNIVPVLYQSCDFPPPLQNTPYYDFVGHNYKIALGQLLMRYFPNREAKLGYSQKLREVSDKLTQTWSNTLRPLLWPGWLGPAILLLLLFIATSFYWRSSQNVYVAPEPRYESLAVINSTPTPVPLPTPVKTTIRDQDGQEMVMIPAGEFLMGSAETDLLAGDDEKPQHTIYLDTFWIDKTEITWGQYQQCVETGVCTPTRTRGVNYQQCVENGVCAPVEVEDGVSIDDLMPVVAVTWEQASTYCKWVGARLPTEAEWEKSARGTDGRLYPWGNEFDGKRLNYCDKQCVADWRDRTLDDGYRYAAPIGRFPEGVSPYGVLDMSGNVWEWTADWYAPDSYANLAYKNPTGPDIGDQRVIRGGSWTYHPKSIRVAKRYRDTQTSSHDNNGFRCVMPE